MTLTNHQGRFAVIGAGFIGKSVIRNLLLKGHEVSVLDRHGCPDEFSQKVTWIPGDFQDKVALGAALQGTSTAYHFVSSTVPGDQHVDVAMELNENVVGTLRFVDSCLEAGVKRIVFASSASVYGVQDYFPIGESAATNPISAHGIHKLTIEKFLLLAKYSYGIDVRIMRIANPYGPGQSVYGRQGFIAIVIGNLLRNEHLNMRDSGSSIRDFIYIDDLAEALALAGSLDGLPSIMNVGSGRGYSLREVVDIIEQLINRKVATVTSESRRVDIPISVLDIGLSRSAMSFSPIVELREGISNTFRCHGIM